MGSFCPNVTIELAASDKRYEKNPERFAKGQPIVRLPPIDVCINLFSDEKIAEGVVDNVNFPTLAAAEYELIVT